MIDRQARGQMAQALRSYMAEGITAFQLDDALRRTVDATEDETVKSIGSAIWFHYDDLKDHKIAVTKEEWDYFNRLLLLLESEGEIAVIRTAIRWHVRQLVAAVSLAAFCAVALKTGLGAHLLTYAMPFGLVSMAIHWWGSSERWQRHRAEAAIAPFPSVASLLSVRRRIPGFRKARCPQRATSQRIRGRLVEMAMAVQRGVMWLVFAPLFLVFQMLPERESETTIRMPEQAAAADC